MDTDRYDVVVVGLGPTGLVTGLLLAERGLRVLALEREPRRYGMARAVHTDDECLRILQRTGLAAELHEHMVSDLPVRWLRADGSVLARFHDPARPHGWPTANFLYQPLVEEQLETALASRPGVTIRRGRAVEAVHQDTDGVTVTHSECTGAHYGRGDAGLVDGTRESARGTFLVACDGGRSVVRTHLGIGMTGRSFPQRWLVVDLATAGEGDAFDHLTCFDFVCDPRRPVVSCPQPHGRHRFEFLLDGAEDAAGFETDETVRRLVTPYVDPTRVRIDRRLVYTFNALVADRWREGRVLLAGDAAHMTPQFIGQGMNAGIRDADNLAWKLAEVVAGRLPLSALDSYEDERRPHATRMIRLSVLNKDVVSTSASTLRDTAVGAVVRVPGVRRLVTEAKVKPRPRYRAGAFLGDRRRGPRGIEGTLGPQPRVRDASGRRGWLDDLARYRWVVLDVEGTGCRGSAMPLPPGVGAVDPVRLSVEPGSDPRVDAWLRRGGVRRGGQVVLRPDGYVHRVVRPVGSVRARRRGEPR